MAYRQNDSETQLSKERILFIKRAYLWAMSPGLVGGDDNISGHKEGSVLGWRHHVVRLVPDSLIHPLTKLGENKSIFPLLNIYLLFDNK